MNEQTHNQNSATSAHDRAILDQFTRQAIPFAQMEAHSTDTSLKLIAEAAQLRSADTLLDVGCGPGLVSCALAPKVAHVTGIDFTPAMIDQARTLQSAKGLTNITWHIGDMRALPFPDASFSCTLSRYTFHHLLEPAVVFTEMLRVTRPGGRIVLIDVAPDGQKRAAYDHMEKLRDPSHTSAMTFEEMLLLGQRSGLPQPRSIFYKLEVSLETLLASSFPPPGNTDRIRHLIQNDIGNDTLGIGAEYKNGAIHFSFPTVALSWQKP
jgi:ubiquinone/menaquinone biosynthesis C-methylase UbiE